MNLSTQLQAVSQDLISKYGNTVTFTYEDTSGVIVYNPVTDEMEGGLPVSISKKAVYKNLTYVENQAHLYANAKKIAIVPYDSDVANMTTLWKIDGNSIVKIDKTTAQDNTIVLKLYVG